MLFHTFVELFSIVVAFAVFILTWNARKMQDNRFLQLVGISYIFIGALDLLHTLTYKGMSLFAAAADGLEKFPANQFWVATRFIEALTFLIGLLLIKKKKPLNSDIVFLGYFIFTVFIVLTIMVWDIFPVCFIEGIGQTPFKIYAEYIIITILFISAVLLVYKRNNFSTKVYSLILASVIITILSEFCFTLYVSNFSRANELGHYAKLISFILIYKANIETAFINPTDLIFKNLKDSEQKYRTLAENLPGLVLRFNEKLTCIYSNTGVFTNKVYDNDSQIKHTDEQELLWLLLPIVNEAKKTGKVQRSGFNINLANTDQFYAVQVIPEHASKQQEGSYLVICQDITELKLAEKQLQSLNETKDKLFSIIAHDLKNPFTSLVSFSEIIRGRADKLERQAIADMAGRMNSSAKQAYTLLENLLSWSRIQTGVLKPVPELLAVEDLFKQAAQLAGSVAEVKSISLIFDEVNDLSVVADSEMTSTILRNLISNALKFSYSNGAVKVGAVQKDNEVVFSIADTGMGIPAEHHDDLLNVGNKFSTKGTAAEQGTGLGLVLCKEFIEINGGKIWLQSELGKGTTFYFTLPAVSFVN